MSACLPIKIEDYTPSVIKKNNILNIWDNSRKIFLKLTPEEFVRQFFIHYLTTFKDFPLSNIATETGIRVNNRKKRTDIIAFKNNLPVLLVECKSMDVELNNKTILQLSNYQSVILATFIAITNGNFHFFYKKVDMQWIEIDELPNYKNI